jgi:hypothetical protein
MHYVRCFLRSPVLPYLLATLLMLLGLILCGLALAHRLKAPLPSPMLTLP